MRIQKLCMAPDDAGPSGGKLRIMQSTPDGRVHQHSPHPHHDRPLCVRCRVTHRTARRHHHLRVRVRWGAAPATARRRGSSHCAPPRCERPRNAGGGGARAAAPPTVQHRMNDQG